VNATSEGMRGLCSAAHSQLVVVDIQARLAAAMAPADRERVIKQSGILLRAAELLAVPVAATEQYPSGLGPTESAVAGAFPTDTPLLEKTCFACSGARGFLDTLAANARPQAVLAGMETHICVTQTAMDLLERGYAVFITADACCTRNPENHGNALERLRQAGAVVTNTESVVFEWLRDAAHEHFKAISALVK
jgi:nicotinamidase-related amidase